MIAPSRCGHARRVTATNAAAHRAIRQTRRPKLPLARGQIGSSNVDTVAVRIGIVTACPKRHKCKDAQGQPTTGRAALAGTDAVVDVNLDAAIGNVLLAADAQPRAVEIGAAPCVRSQIKTNATVMPFAPAELAAQDKRELAIAKRKAKLAGKPLYFEDERLFERSKSPDL
eukprot:3486139-Pleurochrysis_carterae.AAC.1